MVRDRVHGAGPRANGPWLAVAGTRPNYVKLAPLVRAAAAAGRTLAWIDTGQHTDTRLRDGMIADLGLPAPTIRLVAPPSGPDRIELMSRDLAKALSGVDPGVVITLGDVDSTVAAALAAWRLRLPVVHVEAGLRCFAHRMPEERNRIRVDALSDRHYLTEPQAATHLETEGIGEERRVLVGNVMADALRYVRPALTAASPELDLPKGEYLVATLHRQANVDDPKRLAAYVEVLASMAEERPLLFAIHPRTAARLGGRRRFEGSGLRPLAPRPYLAFLSLVARSGGVVTDSGGLPVEAALLDVPCVLARDRTEHALVLSHGGTVLAGRDPAALPGALRQALVEAQRRPPTPEAWDGHAAERIVADLAEGYPRRARRERPPGVLD